MPRVIALVMAGGGGTRLWPASTPERPKQFQTGLVPGGRSLLQDTVARCEGLIAPEDVWVVTTSALRQACVEDLPNVPEAQIVGEPVPRNTAPAIGLGLELIRAALGDDSAVVLALPADHYVTDPDGFRRHLAAAIAQAQDEAIVTLGIAPTHPATGYGYIERDDAALPGSEEVAIYAATRFVEKPDRPTAEGYLNAGRFVWNAGIFVMSLRTGLAELKRCLPQTAEALAQVGEAKRQGDDVEAAARRAYEAVDHVSIDVGVMEKQTNLRVVPTDVGWTDLGSWKAIYELGPADDAGNVAHGDVLVLVDSSGCLVISDGTPLGVVGMRDVVVVARDGKVLVCPLDRAQDVRDIAAVLGG